MNEHLCFLSVSFLPMSAASDQCKLVLGSLKHFTQFTNLQLQTVAFLISEIWEAAKNTLRGGSLKITAFGHKLLTPPRFAAKNTYPP